MRKAGKGAETVERRKMLSFIKTTHGTDKSRKSGSSGGTSRKEASSQAFQTTGFVAGCSILPLDSLRMGTVG